MRVTRRRWLSAVLAMAGAVVKWARGFHAARTLSPAAAREQIRLRTLAAIERLDSYTVRYVAADMTEVAKFLEVVLEYRVDLQP